jgi:hypothetical protein
MQDKNNRRDGTATLIGKQGFEPLIFVEGAERVAEGGREIDPGDDRPACCGNIAVRRFQQMNSGGKCRLDDIGDAVLVLLGDAAIAKGVGVAVNGLAAAAPMITADYPEVLRLHRAGVLTHCVEQSADAHRIGGPVVEQRRQWQPRGAAVLEHAFLFGGAAQPAKLAEEFSDGAPSRVILIVVDQCRGVTG